MWNITKKTRQGNGGALLSAGVVEQPVNNASCATGSFTIDTSSSFVLLSVGAHPRKALRGLIARGNARNAAKRSLAVLRGEIGIVRSIALSRAGVKLAIKDEGERATKIPTGAAGSHPTGILATSDNMSPDAGWTYSTALLWKVCWAVRSLRAKQSTTRTAFATIIAQRIWNSGLKLSLPANAPQRSNIARLAPVLASIGGVR